MHKISGKTETVALNNNNSAHYNQRLQSELIEIMTTISECMLVGLVWYWFGRFRQYRESRVTLFYFVTIFLLDIVRTTNQTLNIGFRRSVFVCFPGFIFPALHGPDLDCNHSFLCFQINNESFYWLMTGHNVNVPIPSLVLVSLFFLPKKSILKQKVTVLVIKKL